MISKTKKIILGTLLPLATVAPIFATVACKTKPKDVEANLIIADEVKAKGITCVSKDLVLNKNSAFDLSLPKKTKIASATIVVGTKELTVNEDYWIYDTSIVIAASAMNDKNVYLNDIVLENIKVTALTYELDRSIMVIWGVGSNISTSNLKVKMVYDASLAPEDAVWNTNYTIWWDKGQGGAFEEVKDYGTNGITLNSVATYNFKIKYKGPETVNDVELQITTHETLTQQEFLAKNAAAVAQGKTYIEMSFDNIQSKIDKQKLLSNSATVSNGIATFTTKTGTPTKQVGLFEENTIKSYITTCQKKIRDLEYGEPITTYYLSNENGVDCYCFQIILSDYPGIKSEMRLGVNDSYIRFWNETDDLDGNVLTSVSYSE